MITKEKKQAVMVLLVTAPQLINMLVRTYAWRGILLETNIPEEVKVYIGMVYNFLPFMILQIYTSLSKMDKSLINAAYDLGCDDKKAFLKVTLPLSVPGIISGITLVFLPAVSSFFIPKLLGGGSYVLVGNLIENYFVTTGDWNFGSAISLVMAIVILISMYVTKKLDYDELSDAEKKAIEDARFVLPNAAATKMVVTMNARSLHNFFAHRCCNRAQWEIRAVANEMLKLCLKTAPNIFRHAGPSCIAEGSCPEGKMTCGSIKEVKQFFNSMISDTSAD